MATTTEAVETLEVAEVLSTAEMDEVVPSRLERLMARDRPAKLTLQDPVTARQAHECVISLLLVLELCLYWSDDANVLATVYCRYPFWAMIFVDSSSTNNQVGANDLA